MSGFLANLVLRGAGLAPGSVAPAATAVPPAPLAGSIAAPDVSMPEGPRTTRAEASEPEVVTRPAAPVFPESTGARTSAPEVRTAEGPTFVTTEMTVVEAPAIPIAATSPPSIVETRESRPAAPDSEPPRHITPIAARAPESTPRPSMPISAANESRDEPRDEPTIARTPPAKASPRDAEPRAVRRMRRQRERSAAQPQLPAPRTTPAADIDESLPVAVNLRPAPAPIDRLGALARASRESVPQPGDAQLPIHVRIGKVEVRPAPTPPPAPIARTPSNGALGFARYQRVRTYRS